MANTLSSDQGPQLSVSIWRLRFRAFKGDHAAVFSSLVLFCMACLCAMVGWIELALEVSGVETDLLTRFEPITQQHWLGTDDAGRDELMRLLRGGSVSLSIGFIAALGASLMGIVIGVVSGYFRGKVDMLLMRFTDFIMSIPSLPLLIILAALDLTKLGFSTEFVRSGEAGYWRIVAILILLGWPGVARLMRASTLALNGTEFVLASKAQGASHLWMMVVHVIPNAISPVIVATTIAMGRFILVESALSFLGVGIQPPSTSWGSMLNNAQELLVSDPPLAIYPGIAILISVVAINFLGDGLQKAFDPKAVIRR
jgi:peptide/nickel transport system permease protein